MFHKRPWIRKQQIAPNSRIDDHDKDRKYIMRRLVEVGALDIQGPPLSAKPAHGW